MGQDGKLQLMNDDFFGGSTSTYKWAQNNTEVSEQERNSVSR